MNLFNVICNDLKLRDLYLNDIDDLFELRFIAKDRAKWKELL